MPIFFILIVIITLWIAYEKKKTNKISDDATKQFWKREEEANTTRKKDISSLPYIIVPFDSLPWKESTDEEIIIIQKRITKLKDKKFLNLTGYTNTDLKLAYGAPNLPHLSEYDHNFTLLTRNLYKWGQLLVENQDLESAKTVLHIGIDCGTDVSGNYTLLAHIYSEEQNHSKILELITVAESIKTLMKDATIHELRNILNTCYAKE